MEIIIPFIALDMTVQLLKFQADTVVEGLR